MGRYKQLFALITPFETLIDWDQNLYNSGLIILQGFLWSHYKVNIFLVLSGYASLPPYFTNSVFVTSSLLSIIVSENLIVKGMRHADVTSAIRMIIDYLKPNNI